jgi:hypothetical protein
MLKLVFFFGFAEALSILTSLNSAMRARATMRCLSMWIYDKVINELKPGVS